MKQIMDSTAEASVELSSSPCAVISVPSNWYFAVVMDNNKPDNVAITILGEVIRLHSIDGVCEFHLGYRYFQSNFNYGRFQIRNALVRLEKSDLLKRDYRTVQINNRKFNNEMFLILNLSKVSELKN